MSAKTSIQENDSVAPIGVQNGISYARDLKSHLRDTTEVRGDFILFLLPDSVRFSSYAEEDENIYELDSDFGFGVSATLDSISRNKKYSSIRGSVTTKRYIVIADCKNCPQTVDRDTIDYAIILGSKEKDMRVLRSIHSGDYLQEVDEYFDLIGRK